MVNGQLWRLERSLYNPGRYLPEYGCLWDDVQGARLQQEEANGPCKPSSVNYIPDARNRGTKTCPGKWRCVAAATATQDRADAGQQSGNYPNIYKGNVVK